MPFARYEEAPGTDKTMTVWWDIKRCPIPEYYNSLFVSRSIVSVLRRKKYRLPITIIAFGNLKDIHVEVLRAYSSTGIVMKHDPFFESACADVLLCTCISSTIMKEIKNSTPVLFISNPEYASYLRFHMKVRGSMSGRNILLAYDYDPGFFPPYFNWKDLLQDAKMDCAGKRIEDEFKGEPGGIFGEVCISYCKGGALKMVI
ncbi:Uncharacterized protein Rs2_39206 [Raphanus sativus]|nr:Uncharacterized protein Rs2_39206 [Raphanus sativus]